MFNMRFLPLYIFSLTFLFRFFFILSNSFLCMTVFQFVPNSSQHENNNFDEISITIQYIRISCQRTLFFFSPSLCFSSSLFLLVDYSYHPILISWAYRCALHCNCVVGPLIIYYGDMRYLYMQRNRFAHRTKSEITIC